MTRCTDRRARRGAAQRCSPGVKAPPEVAEVVRVECPSCSGERTWMAPCYGDRHLEDCPYCNGRGTIRAGSIDVACRQCTRLSCAGCPTHAEHVARRSRKFATCVAGETT